MVLDGIVSGRPDECAGIFVESGDHPPLPSGLYDEYIVIDYGRGGKTVKRLGRSMFLHELGRPTLFTGFNVEGKKLTPRADGVNGSASQKRCGHRTIVGAVMSFICGTNFEPPKLISAFGIESRNIVIGAV